MKRTTLLECDKFTIDQWEGVDSQGRNVTRQFVDHPGAVVIVPVLADGSVVMIENERITVGQSLLELPAGTMDTAETAEATAARELAEETGYRSNKLVKLHQFYSSPGISNEVMHLFVAHELVAGEPAREPGEEIENRIVSRAELMKLLDENAIVDAKTLTGLLLWLRRQADA